MFLGVYKLVVTGASGSTIQQLVTVTVMSEGGDACDAGEGVEGVDHAPIPVTEFGAYVAGLHANGNKKFKDLYKVMLYTGVAVFLQLQSFYTYIETTPSCI